NCSTCESCRTHCSTDVLTRSVSHPPSNPSQPSPSFVVPCSPCITSSSPSIPSPPSQPQPVVPARSSAISSSTNAVPVQEDPTTSTTTNYSQPLNNFPARSSSLPSKPAAQRLVVSEASNSVVSRGMLEKFAIGNAMASATGLALFGVGNGSKALFRSLEEDSSCFLLYIVEEQMQDVEQAFSADFL
uniref:Uncharacterized protein n=1 Tax=Latimeria chalumnae TaxID=7897 RepID=H3BII9_LATCH